jgi:centrosomal CEP192-like protein
VLGLAAVLAALVATIGCGDATSPRGEDSASTLSLSSSTVSFGNVAVGTPVTESVVLTDSGTSNIAISRISITGAEFSVRAGAAVTLAPGQSTTIAVAFAPTRAGASQGALSISSDASNSNLDVTLQGTGIAGSSQLSPSSTTLNFQNVTVGAPAVLPVIFTDNGTATISILSATVTGTGFSFDVSSSAPLAPKGTVTFTVRFDPTFAGVFTGALNISSDAANSAVKISLFGTGVAKSGPSTPSALSSQLTANLATVGFGSVPVGGRATQSVVLTDSGTANVTISGISTTGTGFSVGGEAHAVLAPHASVTVSVDFDPASAGAAHGSLLISSDASNSLVNIPLSGTGTAAQADQPSVELNWQPSASEVIGYFVYRGSSASSISKLFLSPISQTSYTDTSVTSGRTYYYAVTSVNSDHVESSPSNEVAVTIPSP